jgi:hypothetical protein
MFEPDNGNPSAKIKKTEVKVLYDNDALYISALLYDNELVKFKRNHQRDVLEFLIIFSFHQRV